MVGVTDVPFEALHKTESAQGTLQQGEWFHYLDWLWVLIITFAVFAHVSCMGISGGLPIHAGKVIDDRDYAPEYDPDTQGMRAITMARTIFLPGLFWVSGAFTAILFPGCLQGLGKLALYGIVGISINAMIWYLGPQDPICEPFYGCEKGLLFDFTIAPHAGTIFPFVFQMWYVGALLLMLVVNFPIMALLHGSGRACYVFLQWAGLVAYYCVLIWLAGSDCPSPKLLAVILAVSEALYLVAVGAAAPVARDWISRRIPGLSWQRGHQYMVGLLGLLQFSATPIATHIDSFNAACLLFASLVFYKFFLLGFLVTKARLSGNVRPFLSNIWPFAVLLMHWFAPSSNWLLAGHVTYPFYKKVSTRVHYAFYGTMFVFCIERLGLSVKCLPIPSILPRWSLTLYLIHPLLITFLIVMGVNDTCLVWVATLVVSLLLVPGIEKASRFRRG